MVLVGGICNVWPPSQFTTTALRPPAPQGGLSLNAALNEWGGRELIGINEEKGVSVRAPPDFTTTPSSSLLPQPPIYHPQFIQEKPTPPPPPPIPPG